jgi:hypothetical protein
MAMFEGHLKTKVIIMFVVYRGPSDPYEPVTEWDFGGATKPTREDDTAEEEDDDEYFRNTEPQNEHVGVDEEAMYFDNVESNALQVVQRPSNVVDDNENEGGDESQDEDDEEEQCNDQSYAPSVEHDPNNPPMEVGSTYANMYTFKVALSQHAIKKTV